MATIESIRIQFNIPPTTPDSEVIKFAKANNIVIELSGHTNTAKLSDLNNKAGGSLFGTSVMKSAPKRTSVSTNFSINFPSSNSPAKTQQTSSLGENLSQGSIWGGNTSNVGTNDFMGISFNQIVPAVNSDNNQQKAPLVTGDIISNQDLMQNYKVARIEIISGKVVAYDDKNNIIEDANGKPLEISSKLNAGVARIDYKDGKVLMYDETGALKLKRSARFGESGFSEKGENFAQRLQRYYGLSLEKFNKLSDSEKSDYSKKYQAGIRESAYKSAIARGKSKQEANKIADAAVVNDFRALCRRSGTSPEEMKGIATTLYGLTEKDAENEINKYCSESVFKDDAAKFTGALIQNVGSADNSEMRISVINGVTTAAKNCGMEDTVLKQLGNAVVNGDFKTKNEFMVAAESQYNLSPEQANKFYKNLPEEVRQSMTDDAAASVSEVQTHVAANDSYSEDVRKGAADLSGTYLQYIDDAAYQWQQIQTNMDYMNSNADDSMKEYYSNSIANNAYNYDENNRNNVINMLKEQGYESTLKALDEAKAKYDEQAEAVKMEEQNAKAAKLAEEQAAARAKEQAQVQAQAQASANVKDKSVQKQTTSSVENVTKSSSFKSLSFEMFSSAAISKTIVSDEFKSKNSKEKVAYINNLNPNDKKVAISTLVENSEATSLRGLMLGGLKFSIIKYLISHPNSQNTSKLDYLDNFLTPADKKEVEKMKEERHKNQNPFD